MLNANLSLPLPPPIPVPPLSLICDIQSYEIEDSPVVCGTRPRVTLIQVSDFLPSFALIKVSQGEDEEWENLKYGNRVQVHCFP